MTETGEHQSNPILRTKLHRPTVTEDLVCRQRLHELMDRGLQPPLTVVSAPAGYGKSMLVSHWAESIDPPCTWLSLDQTDSDLAQFLAYFLAAVEKVFPESCRKTAMLLQAANLPSIPVLASGLINELDALEIPFVLVLDDYHRIAPSSGVHELFTRLLEHPPRPLRLVLATRRDPLLALVALRAARRLTELRLQDLRFTESESAEFFAKTAKIAVSEDALANLEREVEGWAVGLRLVSLALRHKDDPESFVSELHGGLAHTQEFLLREVLAGQPTEVRDGMLRTSILDRFCPDVVDAVCAPDGLDGQEILRVLQQSQLFTIPLDARGEWFRYHHLFRDLLQRRLKEAASDQQVAGLHARASEWFESRDLIEEALGHALAAGDIERAAQLVERSRQSAVNADRWYVLDKWLSLLPDTLVRQRPELLMARVWILVHHFRFEVVFPILDHIESLLDDNPEHEPLRGEVALFRGYILYFLGDGAGSLKQIEKALERLPVSYEEARAQAEVIHALASQMEGRREQALRGLDDLLAHYRSTSDVRKTRLLVTYVFIHIISGDLVDADVSNRPLLDVAERSRYAYAKAWAAHLQGLIHLHRHELDAAADQLKRSVSQRFLHFKRAAVDSIAGLMFAHQASGRGDEALATLQLLRDYVASLNDPALRTLVDSSEARLALMQGRPESAARLLEPGAPAGDEAMLWWLEVPSVTRCRVGIAQGSPAGLQEARERLRELAGQAESRHNTCHLIELSILQAVACEKQGKAKEALRFLERAVTLARPGGFVFLFWELGPVMAGMLERLEIGGEDEDFIRRLLAAFVPGGVTASTEVASAQPAEPWTKPRSTPSPSASSMS